MRRVFLFAAGILSLSIAASLSAKLDDSCLLAVTLVDSKSGQALPGMVRVIGPNGQPVKPLSATSDGRELLSRGLGVTDKFDIHTWIVALGKATLQVPRGNYTLEAFSGLDTETTRVAVDANRKEAEAQVPLVRFYDAQQHSLRSANTHLHLMKLTRDEANQYLADVPRADGLDLLFVSYLERADADRDYITNRLTKSDLEQLTKSSGVLYGNGEEHRHNFRGVHGYGHVMLLNIPRLVHPVSIGPDIMKKGSDGLPLQRGIDQARRDDGTIIWCHNTMGLERIANLVTGRLHAQNIFDGSPVGSYKDSFYRNLNAGLKTPFATGTDWFIYDFSRTYVKLDEPFTVKTWLNALITGRSYITNGPFLELKIDDQEVGGTVKLDRSRTVSIEARGIGRIDFQQLELIQNGNVIRREATSPKAGHFESNLKFELMITEPCWIALRIPPPPQTGNPDREDPVPSNEYGQPLFAHTSAIGIELAGRRHFDPAVARSLLAELRSAVETIDQYAVFADQTERARVIDVYEDAIAEFERKLSTIVK